MGLHKQTSSNDSISDLKQSSHYLEHASPQNKSFTSRLPSAQALHFDIDKYLNRIVIQNQCRKLPPPVARWFGVRSQPAKEVGNLLIAFWACVGAILGLLVVGAVFRYAPGVAQLNPPVIFASLGATAILEYNTIQSPLSQPRASVVGHTSAAIIGVAVAKLFMLHNDFDSLRWIAGAIACGIASATMTLTNTVHPPGGATAVLAIITPDIAALGWYFPPLVLLGSVLMIGVGLVVNNIQRQFPQFWWTPKEVRRVKKVAASDVEAAPSEVGSEATHVDVVPDYQGPVGVQFNKANDAQLLVIGPHGLVLPEGFSLGPEEKGVVQILQERLRDEFASRGQVGRAESMEMRDVEKHETSDARSDTSSHS